MSNPGRLTLAEQREMEKTLQDCFLKGYSESGVVSITGHNIKTVSKYFKKWHKEFLQHDNTEWSYGLDDTRSRVRLAYDMMLKEFYSIQDDIKQELDNRKLENGGKIPHGKGMYKERMKIAQEICNVIDLSCAAFITRIDWEAEETIKREYVESQRKAYAEEQKRKEIMLESNN